ncbi:MAG: hypothetical protein HZRFUVUK_000645 [Candidatus Fervidibacterota bacterium]|jgi:trigger factor
MRLSHLESVEVEPAVIRLTIGVPPEEVQRELRHLMNQLRRMIHVRGFRPGKAPDAIIRRHIGDENIRSQLLEGLISKAYGEAVSREELLPLMVQRLQLKHFSEEEGLMFEAELAVCKEIKLGDYRNIRVEEPTVEVTEEDVEEELQRLRERFPRFRLDESREAQVGDRVRLRYSITPVDEADGEERTTLMTAGEGHWFPPLNEYVLGKKAGDEGVVEVVFPEDFPNERLAGKNCRVWFRVEAVEARELPELNDEFAKLAAGFETLEELKEEVRSEIWFRKEREAQRELIRRIEDELLRICEVVIPKTFVEALSEDAVRNMIEQLRRDGIPVRVWEEMTKKTLDEFRKEAMEGGERAVKLRFLIEEIAKREGITVSDEDVRDYALTLIERSGRVPSELDEDEVLELLSSARWQLLREKVMDFLVDIATGKGEGKQTSEQEGEQEAENG